MNIYFAGSIRGGRGDKELYLKLIQHLQKFGNILTEHVGDKNLTVWGEMTGTDEEIYRRDVEWLKEADVVVAEVSTPSLGVGYELRMAEELQKRTLCLYRPQEGRRLSPMIGGSSHFVIQEYHTLEEAYRRLDSFFKNL